MRAKPRRRRRCWALMVVVLFSYFYYYFSLRVLLVGLQLLSLSLYTPLFWPCCCLVYSAVMLPLRFFGVVDDQSDDFSHFPRWTGCSLALSLRVCIKVEEAEQGARTILYLREKRMKEGKPPHRFAVLFLVRFNCRPHGPCFSRCCFSFSFVPFGMITDTFRQTFLSRHNTNELLLLRRHVHLRTL